MLGFLCDAQILDNHRYVVCFSPQANRALDGRNRIECPPPRPSPDPVQIWEPKGMQPRLDWRSPRSYLAEEGACHRIEPPLTAVPGRMDAAWPDHGTGTQNLPTSSGPEGVRIVPEKFRLSVRASNPSRTAKA